jgi:hypothetical protein
MSTPADPSAWQDTGALTGTALGGVVRIVADTHMAISARVDAALPAPAKPFNRLHASGARTVYGIVEYAHRRVPQAAATVAQTTGTEPTATGVGKALHPVINGFHGDFIAQEHLSLTIPMSLRVKGRDADVAMDFPMPPDISWSSCTGLPRMRTPGRWAAGRPTASACVRQG